MSQKYEQSESAGIRKELPRVTVEYLGQEPLRWVCLSYVEGKNLVVEMLPGEKDKFDYDYARRVFGDWEVDPDESRDKLKEWSGMIGYTLRRSPSCDGRLAHVKVYDAEGNLLWDAYAQMARWLEHNSKQKRGFGKPQAPPPGGPVPMPEILKNASYDQLKVLWEKSWGVKWTHNFPADVARKVLLPRMSESQIQDVLAEEHGAAQETPAASE